MGTMRILDPTGDTVVTWDLDDEPAVREARALFERLARERQLAFARPPGAPVDAAERIAAFDPGAEEIIWIRPLQGG
jgi:hypothetical protein